MIYPFFFFDQHDNFKSKSKDDKVSNRTSRFCAPDAHKGNKSFQKNEQLSPSILQNAANRFSEYARFC